MLETFTADDVCADLKQIEDWIANMEKAMRPGGGVTVVSGTSAQGPSERATGDPSPDWDASMTIKTSDVCKALKSIEGWIADIREVVAAGLSKDSMVTDAADGTQQQGEKLVEARQRPARTSPRIRAGGC